jgi:hypothetical protein
MLKVFRLFVGLVLSLLIAAPLVYAKNTELGCKAFHGFRLGGAEFRSTSIEFRNFDPNITLTIDEITIFDADGNTLKELSLGEIALTNGTVLGPQSATRMDLDAGVFGRDPADAPAPTPITVIAVWSASGKGYELSGHAAIRARQRNTSTGSLGQERSRTLHECVRLK